MALAWQAGLALDRTRLYEDRVYVARKLQEGLLPDRLAPVPGLEAAVVYARAHPLVVRPGGKPWLVG